MAGNISRNLVCSRAYLSRRSVAPCSDGVPAVLAVVLMGLLMAAAVPAAAQPAGPIRDDEVIQTAVPGDAARAQDSYRSRVRAEMADWRRKMQGFDEAAEVRGKRAADVAETSLRAAWAKTEVEARAFEAASLRDWEQAKQAFEAASRTMAAAWDKARS